MTGAVLSMFKLTLAVAVCPATSVTVPVTTWSRPSVVTVTGAGQLAIPSGPEQAKLTVAFVLCHPFEFGAGVTVVVIAGGTIRARS